jgi:hypothetical protein
MKLSVLIPTFRQGPGAIARVAQACSWASPDIEVIVRDNSGNATKREVLAHFKSDHCRIIAAEPCEPLENTSELLRLASGEFIFMLADDDLCFDRAVQSLPAVIEQFGKDPGVVGVTGHYALETASGSPILRYDGVDSADVVARVAGYLSCSAQNVIYYSVLRRQVVQRTMAFMNSMPLFFSFHDQVQSMLYLLAGRFIQLPRLLYVYDVGPWQSADSAQRRDIDFYKAAGLDPAVNKLHWFLCGFEGAVLLRNASLFPDYPLAQRQQMADYWFSMMFKRFVGQERSAGGSRFADEAVRLCEGLQKLAGQLTFESILDEICGLMELFAADKARRYHAFWAGQIRPQRPASQPTQFAAAS